MELVEREPELALLHNVVRATGRTTCRTVVVAGLAGTGKTELLTTFAHLLSEALVLFATGSRAERGIGFGVLRQLVRHPNLPPAAARIVDRLDRRVAGSAPSRLRTISTATIRQSDARLLDVLCDLLITETKHRPVVIMVDDVHEADDESIGALTYLQRRFRFSRVVLVVSRPTLVPELTNLDALLTGKRLTLSPLSPTAVENLVAGVLGHRWAAEHAAEIHEITGGNPRLTTAVIDDQLAAPNNQPAGGVVLGDGFVDAFLSCLLRLDTVTVAVAQRLALLEVRATDSVASVAALLGSVMPAGVDQVARAIDDLGFAGLLRGGWFRHPAARTAVVRTIPSKACATSLRRGIATGLHRHPASPAPADAGLVAEAVPAGDRQEGAAQCTRSCPDCAPGAGCTRMNRQQEHLAARQHRTGLGSSVLEILAPADTDRTAVVVGRAAPVAVLGRGHPDPTSSGFSVDVPAQRSARPTLGPLDLPLCSEPFALLLPMMQRYIDGEVTHSRLLASEEASWRAHADKAGRIAVEAENRRRHGELPESVRLVHAALRTLPSGEWGPALAGPLSIGVAANTAMGRLDDAADLMRTPTPETVFQTQVGLRLLWSFGEHQMAIGHPDTALDTFFRCGQTMVGWGMDLPSFVPWRIGAAEAQIMLGNRDGARALAAMQLERAGNDAPCTRASALRVLAATVLPEERIALLDESVHLLHACGDRVGLARALRDLSYAHKLTGSPQKARTTAARAVVLARTCDLRPIMQDPVLIEQIAAPQHQPIDRSHQSARRVDLLTEAERRVAVLAAIGHTNRQISKQLFITVSTVEQHLTHTYRKLNLSGRAGLAPLVTE